MYFKALCNLSEKENLVQIISNFLYVEFIHLPLTFTFDKKTVDLHLFAI